MNELTATRRIKSNTLNTQAVVPVLQRACACGQPTHGAGECEGCRTKREGKLQRTETASRPAVAPPIVHDVLRSPGQPLDATTRAFMEPRFGHDFSGVRVHTNTRAAESAQAVNALAYTVGQNVVFGAGQHAPGTSSGKRLMAHELTHVVQQGNRTSTMPMPSSISALADPLEEEAETVAAQITSGEPGQVERKVGEADTMYRMPFLPPRIELRGPLQAANQAAQRMLAALQASCGQTSSLTWGDFSGGVPRGSTFGAETHFHYELATSGSDQVVRAVFNSGNSWVQSQFANPTDRALNGATQQIGRCQQFFDSGSAAGRSGGTFSLGTPRGCDASIAADPAVIARARGDCNLVLGPEIDRVAQLESTRLLRHEQTHYDLACALARKGTQAILNGAVAQTILQSVQTKSTQQTSAYDTQTRHGCNARRQAQWEANIQAGLTTVTIP